jgi:hypothetical protein
MSTLAQKRLKIFNVAQKGPKKLSLSFIKFLLGVLHVKHAIFDFQSSSNKFQIRGKI